MSTASRASDYDAYKNETITVESDEELAAALATLTSNAGGTIVLAKESGPFDISAIKIGSEDTPVLITSEDPGEPTIVGAAYFDRASHIAIKDVLFRSEAPKGGPDVDVVRSDNIEIADSTMRGHADGFLSEDGDATRGDSFMRVRDSEDVRLVDNDIAHYYHGIGALDSSGLELLGNEISYIQGDGFRGGGLSDTVINENHMHSFYGTTQTINHSDMIQLWGTSTQSANKNIEISGNFLDADGGAATQSIFILNEWMGREGPAGEYFENISITDNVIHNGAWHGIAVSNTKELVLENNTVLWDPDAATRTTADSEFGSAPPHIFLRDVPDAQVHDNIAHKFHVIEPSLDKEAVLNDNALVDYIDPSAENYVGKIIVNYGGGGDHDIRDFMIRGDADLGDTGADVGVFMRLDENGDVLPVAGINAYENDQSLMTFSAADSLLDQGDMADHKVEWHFEDGTILEGADVAKRFDEPGTYEVTLVMTDPLDQVQTLERSFEVEDTVLFSADFDSQDFDQSDFATVVELKGPEEAAIGDGLDGQGYVLEQGHGLQLLAENLHIQALNRFEINFDLCMQSVDEAGRMMFQHNVLDLRAHTDGSLEFKLKTDEGNFSVRSEAGVTQTGDWQNVSIRFDGPAGFLELAIDGEVVAEEAASGMTMGTTHALVFGSPWDTAAASTFDNIVISKPASEAASLVETEPKQIDDTPDETPDVSGDEILFHADFDTAEFDQSDFESAVRLRTPEGEGIGEGLDGQGFIMLEGHGLQLLGENDQLQTLDQFNINLDMRMLTENETGRMMFQHNVMELRTLGDGSLEFKLRTDEGNFSVRSEAGAMRTEDWQNVTVEYDGQAGSLKLSIDGELADEAEAEGTTIATTQPLVFGSPWATAAEAVLDNIVISKPAQAEAEEEAEQDPGTTPAQMQVLPEVSVGLEGNADDSAAAAEDAQEDPEEDSEDAFFVSEGDWFQISPDPQHAIEQSEAEGLGVDNVELSLALGVPVASALPDEAEAHGEGHLDDDDFIMTSSWQGGMQDDLLF